MVGTKKKNGLAEASSQKSQKTITSFFGLKHVQAGGSQDEKTSLDGKQTVVTKGEITSPKHSVKTEHVVIKTERISPSNRSVTPDQSSLDAPAFNTRNSPRKLDISMLRGSPSTSSPFKTPIKTPSKTPRKTPKKTPKNTPIKGQQKITTLIKKQLGLEETAEIIPATPSPVRETFTKISVKKRILESADSNTNKRLKFGDNVVHDKDLLVDLKEVGIVEKISGSAGTVAELSSSQTSETSLDLDEFCKIDFDDLESAVIRQSASKGPVELQKETAHVQPLSTPGLRHKVQSVEYRKNISEVHLRVVSESDRRERLCILKGSWCQTLIREGDIVNVECSWVDDTGIIDDLKGMVVVNPDLLLTGTSIVGAVYCQRKAVLSDRFRCTVGAPDESSSIMLIGTLGHELLQTVLKKKLYTKPQMEACISELLGSVSVLHELYGLGKSEEDAKREIQNFLPTLEFFVQRYIKGYNVSPPAPPSSGNRRNNISVWNGKFSEVKDIEENVWSPRYGMKGKIDLSLEVDILGKKKVVPLEVKTGRSSFSAEHRGQVIIYCMAMEEHTGDVNSGLLFYLKDGAMQEIPAGFYEKRGLVQLRNDLSHYVSAPLLLQENGMLSDENSVKLKGSATGKERPRSRPLPKRMSSIEVNTLSTGDIEEGGLPPVLDDKRKCESCNFNLACTLYQRTSGEMPSSPHPMSKLVPEITAHLKPADLAFFKKWSLLLRLEQVESQSRSNLKDLWTLTPELRQKKGTCIANLSVRSSTSTNGDDWRTDLVKRKGAGLEPMNIGIQEGDTVVLSTNSKLAVDVVYVATVEEQRIAVIGERDLTLHVKLDETVFLDKSEYGNTSGILYGNLLRLFDNDELAARVRKFIVERATPTSRKMMTKEVALRGKAILRTLNVIQQKALLKALLANDYLLIKGMPGTGKTSLIIALIQIGLQLGQSVLITAYTHSAVDNILLKLKERGVDFVRIGRTSRIHPEILPYSDVRQTQGMKSVKELDAFYKSKLVIATTCLNMSHPALYKRTFDLCVVDEAAQALLPATLGPLFYSKKWIFVGDSQQLPPVVQSKAAKALGLDVSLFAHLEMPENTVFLNVQYRMNKVITELANFMTYDGKLECGNEAVATATLQLPNEKFFRMEYEVPLWISRACDASLESSIVILDTANVEAVESRSQDEIVNEGEAQIVLSLVDYLVKCGLPQKDMGIIAPYQGQVKNIRKQLISRELSLIEVNTVDQYQGRDKEVIVYSCTKTDQSGESESHILQDKRRLNVAVTRAKHKLILVGNSKCLHRYGPFSKLLNFSSAKNQIFTLQNGIDGFELE